MAPMKKETIHKVNDKISLPGQRPQALCRLLGLCSMCTAGQQWSWHCNYCHFNVISFFIKGWLVGGRFTFFGCIFWRRWSLQQSPMWMLHSFEDRHSSPACHIYIYGDIHLTNIPKIVTPFIISHVLYSMCNISPPKCNFITFPIK